MSALLFLIATTNFVIEPPSCPPRWFDGAALEKMLLADTSSVGRVFVAVMVPDCPSAPSDIQVAVLRVNHPPRQARVDLAGVPETIALRTLALSIGELLNDEPLNPPPAPLSPPKAVTPTPPKPVASLHFGIEPFVTFASFPSRSTLLGGGGLRVDVRPWSWARATIGVTILTRGLDEPFGHIRMTLVDIEAGAGVIHSFGASVLSASGVLNFGRVDFTTDTTGGARTEVDATLFRLGVALGVRYALSERFDVGMELKPGGTVHGVQARARDTDTLGADGFFVEARVGVAYRFGRL